MSALYVWFKLIHLVGACVLLGTGLGIAFFMWMAHRTGDPGTIASTGRVVVIADAVFTAAAVLLQPLSGAALAHVMGYSLLEPWIMASFGLYLMVGACWLPVVWLQLLLRDIAREARDTGMPLPARYRRLFRIWFWLGWPAFTGVVAIFMLMIAKPSM